MEEKKHVKSMPYPPCVKLDNLVLPDSPELMFLSFLFQL